MASEGTFETVQYLEHTTTGGISSSEIFSGTAKENKLLQMAFGLNSLTDAYREGLRWLEPKAYFRRRDGGKIVISKELALQECSQKEL